MQASLISLLIVLSNSRLALSANSQHNVVTFKGPLEVEAGGVQNINIEYNEKADGHLSISYGPCTRRLRHAFHHEVGSTYIGAHPLARRHADWHTRRPQKFVWLTPESIDRGCLQAYLDDTLIGVSEEFVVKRRIDRRGTFADYTDSLGPWFDGVEHLSQKQPDERFVASVKSKRFGILGAGMSGLMISLLLDSVGIHNWEIIEASGRLGGRVHTSYLNGTTGEEYAYAEMGPMRFPVRITDRETNSTIDIIDHRLVFQLAEALNMMNNNDTNLAVNFIPFIMTGQENLPSGTTSRRPDGTVPTVGEVEVNAAYQVDPTAQYLNASAVEAASEAYDEWAGWGPEKLREITTNIFKAHRISADSGHLDFSEAAYLKYQLEIDSNTTDLVANLVNANPNWPYERVYFSATEWRTIDKGLNRLPQAFWPHVQNRIRMHTRVQGLTYNTNTVSVHHSPSNSTSPNPDASTTYDHLFVAIPLPVLRTWPINPPLSSLLTRAITRTRYSTAVKVALHYRTRFWEHSERPVYGGCVSSSIPTIGSFCYPSYNINGTGPGVLLASYNSDAATVYSTCALPAAQHAALVQRAMIETHGPIAAQEYTGIFDRVCWHNSAEQGGSWSSAVAGQDKLYLPAYHQTERNTVFVGEHTSITNAWIWSALESAVRGTVQMLLDLGLVDEAKEINKRWMARWISV